MRQEDATTAAQDVHSRSHWPRPEVARALDKMRSEGLSQRQAAKVLDIPRTTLGEWQRRKEQIDAPEATVAFFESPDGVAMLQQIMVAMHLQFALGSSVGLRVCCDFLEMSGLSKFIASSYGSQQRIATQIEAAVVQFGQDERNRLAAMMEPKKITACVDETFHERMCLVAIEPVSNYVMLETYAEARDACTWQTEVTAAVEDLPVTVVQVTSDEAAGLLAMTRDGFGAVHSPDLFHIQQELSRGTRLPLDAQVTAAEKALERAQAATKEVVKRKREYEEGPRGPGRSPDFDSRLSLAKRVEERAEAAVEQCVSRQVDAREAIEGIATAYHPIDPQTGKLLDGRGVHNKLRALFDKIDEIAQEAGLSDKATKHLAKARRLLPKMILVIAWAVRTMRGWVDDLDLSATQRRAVLEELVPGLYLERVASKTRDTKERDQLRDRSRCLLTRARAGPLSKLSPTDLATVERVAADCANLFQRSSSCVEGRNGQLALRRHHLHRLRDGKLAALTVLHNFQNERDDKTTAAERFFGNRPKNLFQHLMTVIPVAPRPKCAGRTAE